MKSKVRIEGLCEEFRRQFSCEPTDFFSAPGRTELSGNHTDHQHGRVLAASVNLDTLAAVRRNEKNIVRLVSQGYPACVVELSELSPREDEKNRSEALIRGVAARFAALGCKVPGLDIATVSTVPAGSGLSSSAALEILLGTIFNEMFFDGRLSAIELAIIGRFAENEYFGKPCGLMDQAASASGGVVSIDFKTPDAPIVVRLELDLAGFGHALFVVDSGADHADLTGEYAAITDELSAVCGVFGKKVLREIPEADFMSRLPEIRRAAGDRAVLRAMHFYAENERVLQQTNALIDGDFDGFLRMVRQSGRSSWMHLQNVVPAGETAFQELGFTLALCERLLGGKGAVRVHGGGFAGTALAFVPLEMAREFSAQVEKNLGEGSCVELKIRPKGGVREELS